PKGELLRRKFSAAMLALVVRLAAMGLALGTSSARGNTSATVIKGEVCVLYDGNALFTLTTDDHQVGTNSTNDNFMLWCSATVLPPVSGQTQHYDTNNPYPGVPCTTFFGVTYDWHETVSVSGEAKLVGIYPNGA